MKYYFLPEDFEDLKKAIDQAKKLVETNMKAAGESATEGADTWHDNFAFEEGQRQAIMWTKRVLELLKVQNDAVLITSKPNPSRVAIGCTVTVFNRTEGKEMKFKVGSYMNFRENPREYVSYRAPLAKLIMGASVGDVRTGRIGPLIQEVEVKKIEVV